MKMCQDRQITTEAKIDRKWVIQESNEHEFILFMVEENLDWQLAEEKTSLITLGRSPAGMHGGSCLSSD